MGWVPVVHCFEGFLGVLRFFFLTKINISTQYGPTIVSVTTVSHTTTCFILLISSETVPLFEITLELPEAVWLASDTFTSFPFCPWVSSVTLLFSLTDVSDSTLDCCDPWLNVPANLRCVFLVATFSLFDVWAEVSKTYYLKCS